MPRRSKAEGNNEGRRGGVNYKCIVRGTTSGLVRTFCPIFVHSCTREGPLHETFGYLLFRTLPALLPALALLGVALFGRPLDLVGDRLIAVMIRVLARISPHEILRRNLGRLVFCSEDARVGYVEYDRESDDVEQRHAHIGPLHRVDEGRYPSGIEVGGDQSRRVSRDGCEDFSKETGAALSCLPTTCHAPQRNAGPGG